MKAALYARVSSERQDVDLSITAQLKALREYAARNGHEIAKEYVDEAESGKTTARPAFREMIAAARRSQKTFEIILVWKYSRFARSREDSIVFKTMLRKNGVKVVSIKVKDGIKDRPKLEIEPNQAQIITHIFKLVFEGKGAQEIAKQINSEGVLGPRRKGWTKTTIRKIISNEVYTGTMVWGVNNVHNLPVIRVENAWPAIVEKKTFDHARSLTKSRAPDIMHPRRVVSSYLLSGLVKCAHCGKTFVGGGAKSGKFSYYVCCTLLKKGAGSCPAHRLNSKRFENAVIKKIKEQVLTIENLTRLVQMVNEEMSEMASGWRQRLDGIIAETNDVEHRLE